MHNGGRVPRLRSVCRRLKTLELLLNLTSFDTLDTSSYFSSDVSTLSFSIVDLTICQLVLPSRARDAARFMAEHCPEVHDLKLRNLERRGVLMEPWEMKRRQTFVDNFKAYRIGRLGWCVITCSLAFSLASAHCS